LRRLSAGDFVTMVVTDELLRRAILDPNVRKR
jgi:hypothetical protein